MNHDDEMARLRAFSAELAGAEVSPWQPRCVVRAFGLRGRGEVEFTMARWLELEKLRSPVLQLEYPETVEAIEATLRVFGLSAALGAEDEPEEQLAPEDSYLAMGAIIREIGESFALGLKMQPRLAQGETLLEPPQNGMGAWLTTYAALISQCHQSRREAKEWRVGEALAVLCGMRANQGWTVVDETYAQRDAAESSPNPEEVPDA
jgi:hypothetical protein